MEKNNSVARGYAEAILKIAVVEDAYERTADELLHVRDILQTNQRFYEFLHNPKLTASGKKGAIVEIFGRDLSPIVLNSLNLIIEQGREDIIFEMIQDYFHLARDLHQKIPVEVTTSIPMPIEITERLEKELSERIGRPIYIRNLIDKTIMGGIVLRIGEKVIDGSVKARLQQIRDKVVREVRL